METRTTPTIDLDTKQGTPMNILRTAFAGPQSEEIRDFDGGVEEVLVYLRGTQRVSGTAELYTRNMAKIASFAFDAAAGEWKVVTLASAPSWFKRNWKWLLGAIAGVAVITTGVVIYKRRSKEA
jgi:hypothetical protein